MDGPTLPRSIRWRLQLGLLALPNPQQQRDEDTLLSLKELAEYNKSLLQDQRTRYSDLKEEYGEALEAFMNGSEQKDNHDEEEDTDDAETTNDTPEATSLDPLTAMVREQEAQEKRRQELELKYRKERARRNRGIAQDGGGDETSTGVDASRQSLVVIDKDLLRLQPDHYTYHHSRKRLLQEHDDFDISVKERTASLKELLYIHARQHSILNYRQGMHEIASYLLLVLEMDLYDVESALTSCGATNTPNPEEEALLSLLEADSLVNDAFTMFERVMSNLSPAYDVKQSPSQALSPMEEMGKSVVSQLKNVVCDQALYEVVKAMHCPPELYCTRWVRLMFSREVLGWRNVLLLWDVFFDLITSHESITSMEPSKYSKSSPHLQLGRFTLMQVLESTAASMILLQRQALLDADHNESIHVLMNVPPLKNVVPLTATLLSVMRRRQVGGSSSTMQSSTSIASLSASFGQMARGALTQIESTAGEFSFRKLYDTTAAYGLPGAPSASKATDSAVLPTSNHPLAQKETSQERGHSTTLSHSALADSLKTSTVTLTEFLMKVQSSEGVPEEVWEALAQVETVRKQLVHASENDSG